LNFFPRFSKKCFPEIFAKNWLPFPTENNINNVRTKLCLT
jgi:hypothetical protein